MSKKHFLRECPFCNRKTSPEVIKNEDAFNGMNMLNVVTAVQEDQ